MTTPALIPDAIKRRGGRRPGAGRKPAPRPPATTTLAEAWRTASADDRRTFVREHRAWFDFYGA